MIKKLLPLFILLQFTSAVGSKVSKVDDLLKMYEQTAKPYLEELATKEGSALESKDERAIVVLAKKLYFDANLALIKKEVTDEVKNKTIDEADTKFLFDVISSKYRMYIKDLPESFYQEVTKKMK